VGGDESVAPAQQETALVSEGRQAGATSTGVDVASLVGSRGEVHRAAVFIDGFNLYNGIKAKYGHRYLWLDVHQLAAQLLRPDQSLGGVVYCTARLRQDPGRQQRQSTYLWALMEHRPQIEIAEGRFKVRHRRCRTCGSSWRVYEEKETDVNLATALVEHAAQERFDVALLISADGDMCPAVRAVKRLRPEVRVVACFPPMRRSEDLRRAADAWLTIGEGLLKRSQLPRQVTATSGVILRRPKKWC
jgi:uncharacterized LabA/DUF88 family protein